MKWVVQIMVSNNQSDENIFVMIHYSEIGLKKGNRGFFESRLRDNIQKALKDCSEINIKMDFGRFVLQLPPDAPLNQIISRLKSIIGIAPWII